MRRLFGIAAFALLLAGCASLTEGLVRKDMSGLYLGATQGVVVQMVGKPYEINRTTTTSGTHEQWVYAELPFLSNHFVTYAYLYFDNGVLTAIQN